jgi:hypothetical protein
MSDVAFSGFCTDMLKNMYIADENLEVQKIYRVVLEHDQKHWTNSIIRIHYGLIQAIILTFKNNLERDDKLQS